MATYRCPKCGATEFIAHAVVSPTLNERLQIISTHDAHTDPPDIDWTCGIYCADCGHHDAAPAFKE